MQCADVWLWLQTMGVLEEVHPSDQLGPAMAAAAVPGASLTPAQVRQLCHPVCSSCLAPTAGR